MVCVSTSRTLRCPNAGRNCWQNGNIFLSLTSPCRSLCLYPTLLADNPTMPLVCKSLISLLARNLKNRYFSRIFRD
ncbi:hypothetical protein HMPREF9547_03085 [Escherichia coli MS 175-1]|nr:hypothetical protein HMPREF9547_03085 [Escherichia coli MS 175-1]EFK13417.1 hypothetical protein HMPREF9541_04277 [Escherichia coli MS 116-1]ESE07189.1 hypothetical protein HMPREF1616_01753 [Escherichia coli 908658]